MATTPEHNPVSTPGNDDIIDLASIAHQVAKRGRKTEVDEALVLRLINCQPGQGFYYPGSDMVGADFDAYMAEKAKPRPKADGKLETKAEAVARATNAWMSKYRQRASAVATAAGIERPALMWTKTGRLVLGRPIG